MTTAHPAQTPIPPTPASNPPAQPFPVQWLPVPLCDFVQEAAQTLDCDSALVALPALAAVGAAIGNTRLICLKRSWHEPAVIWAATVTPAAALPAAALKLALEPIQQRQGRAMRRHERKMAEHKKTLEKNADSLCVNFNPPPPPPPPLRPEMVSDATVAGLTARLDENPRGLLLALDDLTSLFARFATADSAQHYLSMYHATPLQLERPSAAHPTSYLPHPTVSICGVLRAAYLQRLLAAPETDSGLAARLLLAMPPAVPAKWSDSEVSHATRNAIDSLYRNLYQLQGTRDPDAAFDPSQVKLSPAAQTRFAAFVNELAQRAADVPAALAAAFGQLPGYAARLALIVHCCRQAAGDTALDPAIADDQSLAAGIHLAQWFATERERIHARLSESDTDRHRRQLLQWITAQGGCVSVRDLQRGPRRYRHDADGAEAALRDLVKQRYGSFAMIQPSQSGPVQVFQLIDKSDSPKSPSTPAPPGDTPPENPAENRVAVATPA